jgi:hypothetical protein
VVPEVADFVINQTAERPLRMGCKAKSLNFRARRSFLMANFRFSAADFDFRGSLQADAARSRLRV